MDLLIIVSLILLVFEAVYNAREVFVVNRMRKDKATFMEGHTKWVQVGEGIELVAFVLAGILLYLSDFNVILVVITIALGIYHIAGTVSNTNMISKMPEDRVKKMGQFIMLMCAIEVVFSIYMIALIIPLL